MYFCNFCIIMGKFDNFFLHADGENEAVELGDINVQEYFDEMP